MLILPILLILSAIVLLFWIRTLRTTLRELDRGPRHRVEADEVYAVPDPAPLVSVCLAARNEECAVSACLDSLRAQAYPALEIIVVDDRSTDSTATILLRHASEDPRVRILRSEDAPAGWFGKPNAMRTAITRARGDWILMTDADTVHARSSIRNGLGYALKMDLGALSLAGKVVLASFWAKLLCPQLYAFLALGAKGPRPRGALRQPNVYAACGAYFLVRREVLSKVGGMEVVKNDIAEDLGLAIAIDRLGLGYAWGSGLSLWTTGMHATPSEIFRAFARNPRFTLDGRWSRAAALTLAIWALSLVPLTACVAVFSVHAMAGANHVVPDWALVFGVVQYVIVLVIQMHIRSRTNLTPSFALLAPVAGLLTWGFMMSYFLRGIFRRPIAWKDRIYADPH